MKKRFLSTLWAVVLIAVLAMAYAGTTVYAAEQTVTSGEELKTMLESAVSGDVVRLSADISVDDLSDCQIPDGVTLDGAGHMLTVNTVTHYTYNAAFYSGGSGTVIKDLTISLTSDSASTTAFNLKNGGALNNVTVTGQFAQGVYAEGANVAITDCTFSNNYSNGNTYGIYTDTNAVGTVTVSDSDFSCQRVAMLYAPAEFTGNTVSSEKGISAANANITISNNIFTGTRAVSVSELCTITGNSFSTDTCVEASVNADLSGNYWGGAAPSSNQLVGENNAVLTADSYYTTADKNQDGDLVLGGSTTVPTGTITIGYTSSVNGYGKVWGESGNNASESMVIELYSGETKIGTTSLNNIDGIIDGNLNVTWNFYMDEAAEAADGYWNTVWEKGHPNSAAQPDKVVLYVDGKEVAENVVQMNAADNLCPVTWSELGGVEKVEMGGSGTEADPYTIATLGQLKWFRDQVNAGNTYASKYVKLTADINLYEEDDQGNQISWTPIGDMDVDKSSFRGTFDGDKHTIFNLYICAADTGLGFFGRTGSFNESETAVVKNVKFHNLDVSSTVTSNHGGSYVGGVIANASGNTIMDNVHLTGDIYVAGYGYVGGMIGHGYPDISNCSVDANDGSYVHSYYWCVGGIIGYAGEGGTPISNSSVAGLDIWSAYGGAAAVAGLLQDGNTLTNVSASNVEVTSASDYYMGYIAGNGEASTMTGITATNVTATANGNTITSTDAVAFIGNAPYFDLQDAIAAANTGETVTLVRNVKDLNGATVAADKNIILDLNGFTIEAVDSQGNGTATALRVIGTLTVKDSSEAKTGTLKSGTSAGAGNTVQVIKGGSFTLESGNIVSENNGIYVNGGSTVIIKDGTVTGKARNSAALYLQNGADVTISGGELTAYNGILMWEDISLTITGGKIAGTGSCGIMGNGSHDNTAISISGDAEISGYYAGIYHPQGGTLTIADTASITGWSGIVLKGGDLVVAGGSISGTGAANAYRPVSSGWEDTGDGLYVEHYDNSDKEENYGTPTVKITGGNFSSANAKAVASYFNPNNENKGVAALTGFVYGGTYSDADVKEYIAEGYTLDSYKNAQGVTVYGVKPVTYKVTVSVPDGAAVILKNEAGKEVKAEADGGYILSSGTYTYTVSKSGYKTRTGSFTVEDKDLVVTLTLEKNPVSTPSNKNSQAGSSTTAVLGETPETGDSNAVALYVFMMVFAAAGIAVVVFGKKAARK